MRLSSEIKENLRWLDYEYGGGIKTEGTQVDVIDKPILIVGLGGTGVESLIRVKKSINQYFKPGTTPSGRIMDKPANVEYLAIDSDEIIANLKYKGVSFSKENDEFVQLESANLMSIYRNRDSVFKDLTKDWVSNNLRLQQIKHGAGGIRQAGRFLLFININNVINAITEKINRLTLNRNSKDLLYVFILTGTSGGTGSGTFIDVPYLIRRIAEQKGFETENIGMIFLPDVTLSDNSIDGAAALNIKANGFAGLKELDYLMNLERNGEFFEQNYSDISVRTNEPPYDLCHLISSKDESGKVIASAKNYCMNVAAETIINFIASEEVLDGQNYTINSYLSNIENNRYTFLMTHSQKQPTNYLYNIVGASCAVLPVDYLTNHLTYKIFKELEPMVERVPTSDEIEKTMQALKLDLVSIETELKHGRPKARDLNRYDYGILTERPDIIDEALKTDLTNYREHLELKYKAIVDNIKATLEDKNNILLQHFVDFELGPFYSKKETSLTQENSIFKYIENLRKRIIPNKRDPKDLIQNLEIKKNSATEKLNYRHFFFLRQGITDNVINSSEDYHKAIIKNETLDMVDKIYDAVYQMLADYSYQVIDTHCELVVALKELFDKFKEPEHKSQEETLGDNFTWDMISAEEFCKNISESKELMMSFDSKAILKQFLIEITNNAENWALNPQANITSNLSDFIGNELSTIIGKSMDSFFGMMAGEQRQSTEQYIVEKIDELKSTAKVMFPSSHIPAGLNIEFPPYSYVSVPSNAPSIRANVKRLSASGKISNVKYSKMTNRIYMLNLKIAVALYCYKELNEYETIYEASLSKMAGIHLFEGNDKNWRNLPSPNYDKLWAAGYENAREREKNRRLRRIFDKAMEYGYIRFDEKAEKYICSYRDSFDIYAKFKFEAQEVNSKTISAKRAKALSLELRKFLADESKLTIQKPLFDMVYKADQITPDVEYARGVFIYMPELSGQISQEVSTHMRILDFVEKLNEIELAERKYSDFAQIMYMDKIFKARKNFKYVINDVEYVLYTQDNLQEDYIEYQLFQAFLGIPPKDAAALQRRAVEEENNCDDEQYHKILGVLEVYEKDYKNKLKDLRLVYKEERDGAKKLGFYQTMVDVFERARELIG